jgi:cyclase
MPKKRLIFVLLHLNGQFCISRNFRLQKVGNADWLKRNYNFSKVSRFIDELVILNVESENIDQKRFLATASSIASEVFVPVALGGAIRDFRDAETYFHNGADKVVVNTLLWQNPAVVREIANVYGEQALMASVDYRGLEGPRTPFLRGGESPAAATLAPWLSHVASLGVGEILLNSVDRDGTGMGLDLPVFDIVPRDIHLPFVMMGGVGRTDHFQPGMELPQVSGVATSNLFAFIGKGLSASREALLQANMNMASWA